MQSKVFEVTVRNMHSVEIPAEIAIPFAEAGEKRVRIEARFEGQSVDFHAALQRRGDRYFVMFGKSHQKTLGIFPNDYFSFQLFKDTTKYGVEVPEELEAVLMSDYEAFQNFEAFTPGRKRGIIYMIARYKTSQTRIDKSLLLCENLKRGIKDPALLLKSF